MRGLINLSLSGNRLSEHLFVHEQMQEKIHEGILVSRLKKKLISREGSVHLLNNAFWVKLRLFFLTFQLHKL